MLVIYLKMETERVRVYDCKHCSKVFLTKSGLKRHMSGHLTVKPFKCQMCGTGFCHKSSFKRHIMKNSCTPVDMSKPQTHKLVEKLTRSQYSCPVCGVGFAHKYTFKTHMIMNMCRVLETEQNSLSGSSSIENLSQGESLTVNNSNVPKKRAESPDLGMSDKTMEEVAAHDSQETCIVCRKIFSSKADLELHVKDHLKKKSKSLTKASGIKNTSEDSAQNLLKVFSCQLCGKITKTFMGLNAHSRHCTGSVKNKCSVCDRSFTKPCLLRRHMKRHGINLHMGRVKRRKFPKSVAYIESEPPSPEILTGTNLHMKNQALSLRNETLLFGKAASTEDEASDDYDEMTVYITEEQVEERDLLECDRLDKSDHSGHIAEDPLIDHSNDDICDSSDLRFLENSQGTEEERIVQSNNSIEPAVHRVHDDFIEPVPDICSSTQKSACSSINLCSVTNISASHTTDNGCSDACSVSYNQNTESNNYLAQGSIEYSELHSSLSLSAQNENLGLDPVTITDEINLSDSSSYVQAQVESSVAEGMCQENCGNEFSVKRKEITTVYIEEDLDEEVELFEELTRSTVEKNCTSADPLMRDLLGSEKVFSEDMKPDFPDKTAEHKYSCNVCRMTFSQKNTLRKHMTEHGEKQKFKCSVCWGDFLFESDLAKHMESHEKSQQYTCNFCGLNFVKKCGLVGHLKTHLDVQSFSCDICDRTFATKTPFIKHRREHNAKKRNVLEIVNTEQENSALETQEVNRLDKLVPSAKECNNSVLSSFTVVFGLETSEGNAYDGQVARKYQCNLCERMFNGRVGLKKHLKKHDNPSVCSSAKDIKAVSFDCDVCHMQFRKRNHLARHYSIHKNYSCSVCQQTFKSKRALTFHYKEHVKDEKLLDQDMTDATDPQYPEFDKEHEPNSSDLGISIETCSKENPPEKVISVRKTFLTETDNMESKTSLSPKQHGKLVISNNQQEENILHNNQNIMPDIQQETTSFLHVQQKKQNTLVFADQLDKKVRVKDLFPEQGDDSRQIEDELHTRKFVCHTCGRTFGKKSCLSMHSHIHRGNRPFSCPMCSLTFLCEKSLNVHLYQHKKLSSPDTGKEVFRIRNVNPKKVIAKSSPPVNDVSPTDSLVGGDGERKKPIRECRLAGPRLQDSDEILLACLYCNKRCLTKSALANHIKTHTEYEHFPCKLCGVTFYFEDTLLSHQKKYHNLDQTDVSHKNITESKEEHRGDIEIQSKESEIAMSSSVIDENVKLGCESEKINIAFSCSGNETKSTVGNSKPPCQEGLHLKDMPDVSKDNFTIQQNQNRLETYENNFVEGQSAIGRTMTEVADNKRKLRYACPVCGKVFLYHRMYMRHKLLRCRGTNAYTCQNLGCDRSFNRRYNLNRHMKVHFKSKLGLFSKKIVKRNLYSELRCKSKFKNKASLEYSTDSVVNEHSHNLCGMKDLKESDHEHMKECHSVSSFPDTYEFREEADDKEKGQIALKEFRVKKHEDQTLSDLREPSEKYDAAIRSTKEPKKVRDPLTINYEEQYNHISPTFGCESDEIVEKLSDDDSEGDNFMWRNKQSKKRKGYSCDVCNINLLRYQSYTNHMKLHKELNDIKCASCGECFSNEPELVMHEKTHSSELVIDDDSKHLLETKKGNTKELSPNILLNDLESSPDLRVPVSGKFTDVKATSEVVTKKETLRDLAPKSKKIRLQKSEYDCKVCGRLILHAVDFVMHLSFHRDRDELLHSHYGSSDHLYDVIQLIVQTPICNVCRKVFCICKALGLGEDQDMDMYKCDVCEMKFMVRWSLVDHMSQHGDTVKDSLMIKDMKAYLIKTRGNVNSSEDILMQKKQSEDGRFQCSICGKTTDNTSDYILHLKTHERVYSYKCSFCQKSFKKKLARDNHMRIHEKPRKDYISKDPFKLEEKQNLGSLSTKKDSGDTNFSERRHEELCKRKCMELNMVEYPRNEVDNGCVKPTEGMIGERESKETSSSEKNVSVHCEVFDNMDNIGTKQENKQNDGKNIDVSSVSNKSTRNNATESSKEAYVCPVCNESFTRYQKLLSHEKVHFEPVMYDCEKCKHFFQCKEDYDEHLKTHSSRNFSKYYGCPVCGKKMANHANFLRHCASHSPMHNSQTLASGEKDKSIEDTLVLNSLDGEDNFLSADQKKEKIKPLVPSSVTDLDTELVSENKKPAELLAGIRDYKLLEAKKPDGSKEKSLHCKFCDLVFNSLVDFHKHNLIHDFTCKFCGHTFSRKSKYKMHVKRHSAKDKRCKSCWRRFLRNREFELHKKTHRIESISNKNSSAQDSREEANTSSDEVDSSSKHPVKTNLGIDENETKIKEKGYRNRTSKLVNDSLHLENKGLDYNDLKMFNLEQDPLNSNENVTILKDPGKGGTSEAGLRVQKLLDKKLHKCHVCEESFLSYAKYLAHRKVHSKDPQITCSICKHRFGIREYVEHIDDLNCMPSYSCFQCGKKYSDHQLFTDHCKEHDIMKLATPDTDPLITGNDSISCPNITEKLDCLGLDSDNVTPGNLGHLSNHNACHICHRKCESSYILNIHMEEHFKNKPFKCDICLKSLQGKQQFKRHLENHLLNSFICRICNKSFTHQYMLVSHLQKKHNLTLESAMLMVEVQDEEKYDEAVERDESVTTCNIVHGTCDVVPGVVDSFICSICSKSFSHKYKLVTHLRKGHKLELDQAKQLAAKAHFKERVNVTETEESVSSSTFVQRDGLVSTVYESEMELKAKEISVGKKEKRKKIGEDLPSVISDTSVDKISISGRKRLVCPLCGKVCSCRSNLNDHVISHSSDKPWRCPDCKIKFKRLWDRNRHIRNKHGCDPKTLLAKFGGTVRGLDSASTRYDCAICDKRFLYDSVLKMHMMFHTGESSLDYVACEEEEFYECAVERNEDDGLPGLERVLQETRSNEEKVFVADYLDREYNTEDAAIEIKEEIIDIDDVEDIITEDFDVFSDLVLEPERNSLEHSPIPSIGEEPCEMNALSLDSDDVMDAQNEERENVNISKSNVCSIVTDKNSDSLWAEELPSVVDEGLESLSLKGNETTCDIIKSVDVTSSGLNTCESNLDLNIEINRKNTITDETSSDMTKDQCDITKDQLESLSQDEVCCGSKATEMENVDTNRVHVNRDAESDTDLAKDIPVGLGLSELSREVKMLIETKERKRNSFVSKKNVYCSLCDLYFSTQRQLFGHIHIHSGCVFYQCDVCGETVKNSKQYKEHALSHITDYFDCNDETYYIIKKETGKSTKFSCSICGKSFASRHQLTGHLHVHSREFTRSCEACGETFESNRLAVNHLYEHLTLLFKGPTAAQIREVKELKDVHMNNLPSLSELEFSHEKQDNDGNEEVRSINAEPKLCHDKIITHNDSVSCHEEMTISSKEEKIINNRSESYHDSLEITNEKPEFIPEEMNATTNSPESCQEEFSATSNKLELCYKEINTCNSPPESFHKEDEITSNLPKGLHTDSTETCSVEVRADSDKQKLALGEPELTPCESEVTPFESEFSPTVELSEPTVHKKEISSSKETNKPDPDFKPYSCMYCSKLFLRKDSMRIHMRLHTGDRILECDVCSKTFVKKSHLTKHMKVHSKSFSS